MAIQHDGDITHTVHITSSISVSSPISSFLHTLFVLPDPETVEVVPACKAGKAELSRKQRKRERESGDNAVDCCMLHTTVTSMLMLAVLLYRHLINFDL